VWSRPLPANTPKITQLFLDGKPMRVARWPNLAGWARHAPPSAAATATLSDRIQVQSTDQSGLAGREITGAKIHVRTQPWLIESRTVRSYASGELRFDHAMNWSIEPGESYVLEDKRWMLDEPGEYFHDTVAQRLYFIPPADTPSDLNRSSIEGSVRDTAISIEGRSGLSLRNLAALRARDTGILVTRAYGVTLKRISAIENGGSGVRATDQPAIAPERKGFTVTESVATRNGLFGIEATETTGALLLSNVVNDTGTGRDRTSNVIASIAAGPGARIESNIVHGSGYVGINFSAAGGSAVLDNVITEFCSRLTDCGGIYTYTGRPVFGPAQLSTVSGNHVIRASLPDLAALAKRQSEIVVGIYIDDFTVGSTVVDNVVAQVPVGIFVHNASGVNVTSNRLWLVSEVGLWASLDRTDGDWMRDNRFVENEIVPLVTAVTRGAEQPRFTAAQPIRFWHAVAGVGALGQGRNYFEGNRVIQLQGDLAVHAWLHGSSLSGFVDLDQWRQLNPQEPVTTKHVRFEAVLPTLGSELVIDANFDNGLAHWQSWRSPYGTGFAVAASAPDFACGAGCVSFTAGATGDLLASRPFRLRDGATYRYRVLLHSDSVSAALGAPYVSREVSPWDSMAAGGGHETYLSRRATTPGQLDFESYFVAKESAVSRVNLQMESVGVRVGIDAVSVREVTGWLPVSLSDWAALAVAPAGGPARSYGCSDLGWPANCSVVNQAGQPVALPVTLYPRDRPLLLLRADSPLRRW
jgi:hypothetical protein